VSAQPENVAHQHVLRHFFLPAIAIWLKLLISLLEINQKLAVRLGAKPKRKPSNKVKAMKCKQGLTRCAHCSVKYGEASDTRRGDGSVKCLGCDAWFHESCTEVGGILEEAEFHRRDCV